jgi:hypothetical protein
VTDGLPVVRHSTDFVAMDLGVRAAKAICDRFGAQVVDYSAEGAKGSITLRIPSRRERFTMSAARYQAALSGAAEVLQRTSDVLERAEHHRRANRALRSSLAEHRRALNEARLESRRIIEALPARAAERPGPH